MTLDPSRLIRAAIEYLFVGIDLEATISDAVAEMETSLVLRGEVDESDVLNLVAATIVLADNLGYSLDDVLTKLESKGAK